MISAKPGAEKARKTARVSHAPRVSRLATLLGGHGKRKTEKVSLPTQGMERTTEEQSEIEEVRSSELSSGASEGAMTGNEEEDALNRLLAELDRARNYMPLDEASLTTPPPCNPKLHDMLHAHPERALENHATRDGLDLVGDSSGGFKVKMPGPRPLRELQQAFGEV